MLGPASGHGRERTLCYNFKVASSRRLEPDGVDGNPERVGPDRAFVAGAAATFFLLVLVAEAAARWAAGSGWLYRRLDFSGSLTSLPELEQRIAWNAGRPRPVFLLGDSVLGATALWEHRLAHPRRLTIPARLAPQAAAAGWSVQSLGADGLLLPDLEAIDRAIGAAPARRLIVLNVRMFATEFSAPGKALSRDFLLPEFRSVGDLPDSSLGRRDDALGDRLCRGDGAALRPRPDGVAAPAALVFPDPARRLSAPPRADALRLRRGEHGPARGRAPPEG